MKIKRAIKTLHKAMKDDPELAYVWHCSVAMNVYDELPYGTWADKHAIANGAASRVMKALFNVDTEFKGTDKS